jgi:8-oxo-dGTP pyrophosphatase MutT (NUDIX family)
VSQPVRPVDAASVILVRHGQPVGSRWQCFMVRRPVRSEFAADVFVFPGGKVDAADRLPDAARYVREHPGPLALEDEETRLALRLAALRELFEEVGVLLATRDAGGLLRFAGEDEGRFALYRRRLQAGELSMLDLARAERLCFAADRLHPFSRWITPEPLPRRYDTRFFVAYLPDGQEPLHDARETVDSVWISPKDALDASRQGEFPLVFATEKHLERMARYPSIEQMIASVAPAGLEPVMPRIVQRGGETAFLLPGDEGY